MKPETANRLKELENEFCRATRKTPAVVVHELALGELQGGIAAQGGVYGIWKGDSLIYFGETCHLNHRLDEIVKRGRHHSLRLLMGTEAVGKSGKEKAAWFCAQPFTVSWMVVDIGRTELEEYMILKHKDREGFKNQPGIRFSLRGDREAWEKLIKEPEQLKTATVAIQSTQPTSQAQAS